MTEPLTVLDLKTHLRLDADDSSEDSYLAVMITAARRRCELLMNRSVEGGARVLTLDAFPADDLGGWGGRLSCDSHTGLPFQPQRLAIVLPGGQCASVDAITYIARSGEQVTLAPSNYSVDTGNIPGRVAPWRAWPIAAARVGAVTISYTLAGMSDDDTTAVVGAMQLLIGHWYRNRESVAVDVRGTPIELPNSVTWILEDLRIGGLR